MDTITSNTLGRLYRDGEVIFRQGELGDCMYVILDGKVELLQRKNEQEFCLGVLEKGDFFGEMGLFEKDARPSTARSLGGVILLTVDKRTFQQRMHEDPSFAYKILRRMARRVRELESMMVRLADVSSIQAVAEARGTQPPG